MGLLAKEIAKKAVLVQDGCLYVSAYNNGAFDEIRDSIDLSAWLSTVPAEHLAQVDCKLCASTDRLI